MLNGLQGLAWDACSRKAHGANSVKLHELTFGVNRHAGEYVSLFDLPSLERITSLVLVCSVHLLSAGCAVDRLASAQQENYRPCGTGTAPNYRDTILDAGLEYGTLSHMAIARKITVEVPPELLDKAQRASGTGITQTVRTGLQLVAASRTYARLRQLRGKVRFSRNLAELKADR